ncbi:hypothetical protein CRD60_02455 [Bifidobacterium aemilianum]|uniref:Uncharacterized protein n=1 Tax=Bifidobacterium aemilianum TaxID=2493120 RepID=A0A366K8Q9_9BIFI|nr:hypothetical protein CRD60_02455 [Bifidobacterium aemilianum]
MGASRPTIWKVSDWDSSMVRWAGAPPARFRSAAADQADKSSIMPPAIHQKEDPFNLRNSKAMGTRGLLVPLPDRGGLP